MSKIKDQIYIVVDGDNANNIKIVTNNIIVNIIKGKMEGDLK